MPLLVISKFDKDPTKMKALCSGQHLPHYKSMHWKFRTLHSDDDRDAYLRARK